MSEFTYKCTTPKCKGKETYSFKLGKNLEANHKCQKCKPSKLIDKDNCPAFHIPDSFTATKNFGE